MTNEERCRYAELAYKKAHEQEEEANRLEILVVEGILDDDIKLKITNLKSDAQVNNRIGDAFLSGLFFASRESKCVWGKCDEDYCETHNQMKPCSGNLRSKINQP